MDAHQPGLNGGTGRCPCGAVRYAFDGPPNWQDHCHCESCRRATSSAFTSYFAIGRDRWRWLGAAPAHVALSSGVTRYFCARCGTQVAYETHAREHETDFLAATLDDSGAFQPEAHDHWDERVPWITLSDRLPRRRTPVRLTPDDDMAPVLRLIRASFAFMDGRIDPPSSAERLTTDDLVVAAGKGEVWVLRDLKRDPATAIACMVLSYAPDHLYLGKVAVDAAFRGTGLARQLIRLAVERTRASGLASVRLQTRVELTENQKAFAALGFTEIGRSAHPGYERPTSITFERKVSDPI
jgi:predicted N-acetyltransferase YhbS